MFSITPAIIQRITSMTRAIYHTSIMVESLVAFSAPIKYVPVRTLLVGRSDNQAIRAHIMGLLYPIALGAESAVSIRKS